MLLDSDINVKWPEDLLQWMRWLEFTSIDFTSFLETYRAVLDGPAKIRVPHGAVSTIVAMIGIAYIAEILDVKGYTSESVPRRR